MLQVVADMSRMLLEQSGGANETGKFSLAVPHLPFASDLLQAVSGTTRHSHYSAISAPPEKNSVVVLSQLSAQGLPMLLLADGSEETFPVEQVEKTARQLLVALTACLPVSRDKEALSAVKAAVEQQLRALQDHAVAKGLVAVSFAFVGLVKNAEKLSVVAVGCGDVMLAYQTPEMVCAAPFMAAHLGHTDVPWGKPALRFPAPEKATHPTAGRAVASLAENELPAILAQLRVTVSPVVAKTKFVALTRGVYEVGLPDAVRKTEELIASDGRSYDRWDFLPDKLSLNELPVVAQFATDNVAARIAELPREYPYDLGGHASLAALEAPDLRRQALLKSAVRPRQSGALPLLALCNVLVRLCQLLRQCPQQFGCGGTIHRIFLPGFVERPSSETVQYWYMFSMAHLQALETKMFERMAQPENDLKLGRAVSMHLAQAQKLLQACRVDLRHKQTSGCSFLFLNRRTPEMRLFYGHVAGVVETGLTRLPARHRLSVRSQGEPVKPGLKSVSTEYGGLSLQGRGGSVEPALSPAEAAKVEDHDRTEWHEVKASRV
jgi:hypothetical protein